MESPVPTVNPLVALRRKTGLSLIDFAAALNIGVSTLAQAEKGLCRAPRAVFLALDRFGYDAAQVEAEYLAWRETSQADRQARIRNAVAAAAPKLAGGGA